MKIKTRATMNPSVLESIKHTEKKAASLVKAAERESEKITKKAKEDALARLSAEREKLDVTRNKKLKEEEAAILEEKKKLLQKGKRDLKALEAHIEKNMDKTVQYLLQEFESSL